MILRFFEGDVPMMTCSGDTVSGTKKRESRSEEFIANSVYPDIESTLTKLKNLGKTLVVATSKNMNATDIVLEHFDLKKYFEFVASSNFADRHTKTDVINYALSQFEGIDKEKVLMIGDRNQDINAANNLGLNSVGVLWGYGDREELETAGATYIIEKPGDLIRDH